MDLAKFVVLVIVCIAALGFVAGRKGICPSCHMRALKKVNFIKANIFVHGLGSAPDSWSFHQCETCSARFKHHRGQWIRLSADEWRTGDSMRRRSRPSSRRDRPATSSSPSEPPIPRAFLMPSLPGGIPLALKPTGTALLASEVFSLVGGVALSILFSYPGPRDK